MAIAATDWLAGRFEIGVEVSEGAPHPAHGFRLLGLDPLEEHVELGLQRGQLSVELRRRRPSPARRGERAGWAATAATHPAEMLVEGPGELLGGHLEILRF